MNASTIALGFLTVLAPSLHAETEAIALRLNPSLNYTVPFGKTLLIEHISASASTNTPATSRIVLQVGYHDQNDDFFGALLGFPVVDKYETVTLERPIRIGSGRFVSSTNFTISYGELHCVGLLVDNSDLYAQNLDLELKALGVENGKFMAEATLDTPRPAIVRSQTSTDLATFVENATEEKFRQSDPFKWTLSTAADAGSKFLTATATARESE